MKYKVKIHKDALLDIGSNRLVSQAGSGFRQKISATGKGEH